MSARQHLLLVVSPLGDARSRTRADPNKLGWIGHYRVDKNKTACDNLTTADDQGSVFVLCLQTEFTNEASFVWLVCLFESITSATGSFRL